MTNCCCHPTLNYSPTQARDSHGRWAKLKVSTIKTRTSIRYDLHIDKKNIGFAVVRPSKRGVLLHDLHVTPDYQGQGLGKRLMEEVLKKHGSKLITLRASPHYNKGLDVESLVKFYQKFGFVKAKAEYDFRMERRPDRPTLNADPIRLDPTRTVMLRKKFMSAMTVRFDLFKKALYDLVVKRDALGLGQRTVFNAWFGTSERRMDEFKKWLRTQFSLLLLSKMSLFGEENDSDSWLRAYIDESYQRGLARAWDDWKRPTQTMRLYAAGQAYQQGGKTEFMRQSFGGPVSVSRVRLLASRAYDTLKSVTEQMAATISHVLSDAMVMGDSPKDAGKKLNAVVDGYKNRGITIARTETVRAHNEGALTGLENLGATQIGVMVEWSTSKLGVTKKGNPSPCKLCAPLAKTVLTIEEARGLLPRHPNCLCSLVPANVGEDPAQQKRKYEQITKAIQTSLDMERPKSKTALVKSGYSWLGVTKRIAKSRPSLV